MSLKTLLPIACIILLVLAVPPMWPYGYYVFLRVFICGASAYLAYLGFDENKEMWGLIFVVIAILFNPFIPVYFNKDIWVVIDILVAAVFFASMFVMHYGIDNCK